jgi:protease I
MYTMTDTQTKPLSGKRVAILVADGFEQVELQEPRQALIEAGAVTEVVSPNETQVQGWDHDKPSQSVQVDRPLNSAQPADYDAILLPGGVQNPDKLRVNGDAMDFLRHFFNNDKPIAAICHGPWSLVEINAVRGRTLTSWPSLHTDIINAGGNWVDQEVVVDNGLVTSRKPSDIPAFNRKMIEEFAEGRHDRSGTEENTLRERQETGAAAAI